MSIILIILNEGHDFNLVAQTVRFMTQLSLLVWSDDVAQGEALGFGLRDRCNATSATRVGAPNGNILH